MSFKESEPIKGVGRAEQGPELESKVQKYIRQEQELTQSVQKEKGPPPAETLARLAKELPQKIQRTLAKMDAAQVYQTFRLPGRDVVVHDRRDQPAESKPKEAGEKIAEESKQPLEQLLVQKGKLVPEKAKGYENFLGDPAAKIPLSEQRAAAERVRRLFTLFEQILVDRFEGGKKLERPLQDGRFVFLQKTAKQWKEFFSRFVPRTVKRRVTAEQIREWVFRGLVQSSARATAVGDLALTSGQIEKFSRFRLSPEMQTFVQMLSALPPGSRVAREELARHLRGELEYLAIRSAREELPRAEAPTQGKFLTALKTEEKIADELGLQLTAQLREKEKVLRDLGGQRRGGGGGLLGEGESEGEGAPETQFIPWWQYGPLKKTTGRLRWFLLACLIGLVGLILAGLF